MRSLFFSGCRFLQEANFSKFHSCKKENVYKIQLVQKKISMDKKQTKKSYKLEMSHPNFSLDIIISTRIKLSEEEHVIV